MIQDTWGGFESTWSWHMLTRVSTMRNTSSTMRNTSILIFNTSSTIFLNFSVRKGWEMRKFWKNLEKYGGMRRKFFHQILYFYVYNHTYNHHICDFMYEITYIIYKIWEKIKILFFSRENILLTKVHKSHQCSPMFTAHVHQ